MFRKFLLAAAVMIAPAPAQAESLRLFAAGSLRAAMTELIGAFRAARPEHAVESTFGPSGLLRERVEKGETAHVFASADKGHPQKLIDKALALNPLMIFARNELCGIARPGLNVTSDSLLDTMLDPAMRLGISTPKADPSGDYAIELFAKAEALKPGATAALTAKALKLTGGPTSEQPPAGKSAYGHIMGSGKADLFLTYCTNALIAQKEVPGLRIVKVPAALSVGADYGMVVLKQAPPVAAEFAAFVKSTSGQGILARHGFGAGG